MAKFNILDTPWCWLMSAAKTRQQLLGQNALPSLRGTVAVIHFEKKYRTNENGEIEMNHQSPLNQCEQTTIKYYRGGSPRWIQRLCKENNVQGRRRRSAKQSPRLSCDLQADTLGRGFLRLRGPCLCIQPLLMLLFSCANKAGLTHFLPIPINAGTFFGGCKSFL